MVLLEGRTISRGVGLSEPADAALQLFDLDSQSFLLFPEFVDFPGQTHSFSIEFDHDRPSDTVIDLPQIVCIDNLFDQIVSLFDGFFSCGLHGICRIR